MRATTLQEKLADKYQPIPWSGCWIWTGATYGNGRYGTLGKYGGAHRAAWTVANGPIPLGMNVLHKCDVGLCVNPDHLFLGTQADNVTDMIQKGRKNVGNSGRHGNHARGERNGSVKASDGTVASIRISYLSIKNKAELARRYGLSESQIRRIVQGESRAQ